MNPPDILARYPALAPALFPVVLVDIGAKPDNLNAPYRSIPGFKAVTKVDDGHVFAVVRDNYELITNEDACLLGQACFAEVFGQRNAAQMQFFNLRMSQSESICRMDFYNEDEAFYLGGDNNEKWHVFLRISNSYNRTVALKFDIGFCRWQCRNGVIFDKDSIVFKYRHDRSARNIVYDFRLKYASIHALKQSFVDKLEALRRHAIEEEACFAAAYAALGFHAPKTDEVKGIAEQRNAHLRDLIQKYREDHGRNAYALLNAITDFASHPKFALLPFEADSDALERRAGEWMMRFLGKP